jgi:hypothetical protein
VSDDTSIDIAREGKGTKSHLPVGMMQMMSLPSIFALHTLCFPYSEAPGSPSRENHVPFLSQPKVLNPKDLPHLLSQPARPFKLIEIVLYNGGSTCNPFVKGIDLLCDVLDALNLLPAQVFNNADLFVQPLQLSPIDSSPGNQVLSDIIVVVAPRGVAGGLDKVIYDFFDLTHTHTTTFKRVYLGF